jgi:hypothetical protein
VTIDPGDGGDIRNSCVKMVSTTAKIDAVIEESLSRISRENEEAGFLLQSALTEIRSLRSELGLMEAEKKLLSRRVSSAYITLYDHDGYYDSAKKTGNALGLAGLIDDAIAILSGSEDKNS